MFRKTFVLMPLLLFMWGCGGSSDNSTARSDNQAPASSANATTTPFNMADHVDVAALTDADAARGAEIFESKCTACHKIDERYVGPALMGVTERRSPEWIVTMITNPEGMIANDPDAKALFTEFLTPMTNQNINEADAKALFAYLQSVDASAE